MWPRLNGFKISPEFVPWPLCLTSFLCTLQREQACRYGSYCKADPSCVIAVAYASCGHVCALVGWTVQLPGLDELQGGQGGVGWAGMSLSPPHLPLLVAGTMYCCSSFGCTWKDLSLSPALMVPGTTQPHEPSQFLSAQILGSQGFSIIKAFGGVFSHLRGLQSVLVEDLPLASSRSCFPSSGFAILGIPMFLLHFLACGHRVYATSEYFSWGCFLAVTLFSMAGCLCYIFDL